MTVIGNHATRNGYKILVNFYGYSRWLDRHVPSLSWKNLVDREDRGENPTFLPFLNPPKVLTSGCSIF